MNSAFQQETTVSPPTLTWEKTAQIMVEAANQTVGRGKTSTQLGTPFTDEDALRIQELRREKAALWEKWQRAHDTAEEKVFKAARPP